MDRQDDPEARIRELEHQLTKRASELGTGKDAGHTPTPPMPPPPTQPWPSFANQFPVAQPPSRGSGGRILLVLAAVTAFLVAGGVSAYVMLTGSDRSPGVSGGGGSIADESPSRPSRTIRVPTPTALPPVIAPEATTAPGETIIVTGIDEHRTIECTGNTITVAGIENTVTITGHCASLAISGIKHHITIDSVDTIVVSGIENQVTYHSGAPEIAKSGQSNIVEQG